MEQLPNRKTNRLKQYNYSSTGAYFITICVQDKRCLLSTIGEADALHGPAVNLTEYGHLVLQNIEHTNASYSNAHVDHYVIMPNHVHLLISIANNEQGGPPRSSTPTSAIPRMIAAFKKFTNKACGCSLWQRSYHDHVIRNDEDYRQHWQYIDENPLEWTLGKDDYYAVGDDPRRPFVSRTNTIGRKTCYTSYW